jgi:hypothetical protein
MAACHNLAVICATMGEMDDAHSVVTLVLHGSRRENSEYHDRITLASILCMAWIQHARRQYLEARSCIAMLLVS